MDLVDYYQTYEQFTPECKVGVPDCRYLSPDEYNNTVCSLPNGDFSEPESLLWNLVLAGILAGLMCFGIGANDAANAWATAVGSGALPLRFAVVLGGFMEWAGAMALGYGVAKTVTKGTAKVNVDECFACGNCDSKMTLYGIGMLAALTSASLFLLLATFSRLPVSTTHAIIGATVGATVTNVGFGCLNWKFDGGLGGVIASWFISPILSGILGVIVYFMTKYTMIYPFWNGFQPVKSTDGWSPALVGQPIVAGSHSFIILFMTMLKTPQTKKLPTATQALYAGIPAACIFLAFLAFTIYYQKKNLPSKWAEERKARLAGGATEEELDAEVLKRGEFKKLDIPIIGWLWNNDPFFNIPTIWKCCGKDEDDYEEEMSTKDALAAGDSTAELSPEGKKLSKEEEYELKKEQELLNSPMPVQDANYCFRALLIYNAVWDSFAHGANDTGNATGAFAGAYNVYQGGNDICSKGETPVYIMAIAGAIMFIGITTMGQFVIKTIGSSLAFIDYHIGFTVEMASTIAVILATFLDLPVSTTHCQVGAIVFVGLVSDWRSVSWKWFGAVSAGWLLTVPIAALLSAAFTAIFREAVRN